jgi:hypothetical protein
MAHQYRQRILVTLRADGEPGEFIWRGVAYSVDEVLARWHLRDRWWEARATQPSATDDLAGHDRDGEGVRQTPLQQPAQGRGRGTEVPAYDRGGLKSTDLLQRAPAGSAEALSGESLRVSPDFSPSAPCAGGRPPDAPTVPRRNGTPSDRYYYRLRCVEGLLCEVYWDAASDAWTLDRVLD